jgi:cobalamin biosynthesis protein CbiD
MTGKISKLAAGHLYTNISDSKVDMNFLAGVAAGCGVPDGIIDELKKAATANHFRKLLPEAYAGAFCDALCRLAAAKCRESTGGKLAVECVMSSYDGAPLGRGEAGG